MGHPYGDILDTMVHGAVDKSFHSRNERLATFKAKAFLVGILASNELLEGLRPYKAVKDHPFFLQGVVPRFGHFNALTDPIALVFVWDVDVLDPNSAT
jgi:hypothetical protein